MNNLCILRKTINNFVFLFEVKLNIDHDIDNENFFNALDMRNVRDNKTYTIKS